MTGIIVKKKTAEKPHRRGKSKFSSGSVTGLPFSIPIGFQRKLIRLSVSRDQQLFSVTVGHTCS